MRWVRGRRDSQYDSQMVVARCTHCDFEISELPSADEAFTCPRCAGSNQIVRPVAGRTSRVPESRAISIGVIPSIALGVVSLAGPDRLCSAVALMSLLAALLGPIGALIWYWRQLPRRWSFGFPLLLIMYGILALPTA